MDSRFRGNDKVARGITLFGYMAKVDSSAAADGNDSMDKANNGIGGDNGRQGTAFYLFECARSAAVTVFAISMATVMGPTPPGTGVMAPATWATLSKCASPTKR